MPRIPGATPRWWNLFTRFAYFMCRRRLGRVIMPIQIHAHHPRLLRALVHMELGQEAARTLPPALKALAQIEVARRIGCPF